MKCDRRWWNDGRVRREAEQMQREAAPVLYYTFNPASLPRISLPPGPNGFDPLLEAL
jgi:hypothetical protein